MYRNDTGTCSCNSEVHPMTKKQKTLEIIRRLKEAYPDADCTLDYEEAWKLLVSFYLPSGCPPSAPMSGSIRWFRHSIKSFRM